MKSIILNKMAVRKGYYEDNKEDAIIMWLRE